MPHTIHYTAVALILSNLFGAVKRRLRETFKLVLAKKKKNEPDQKKTGILLLIYLAEKTHRQMPQCSVHHTYAHS